MSLSCINEDGNNVDGYTILKKNDGYQYFVYNSATSSFELSPYFLNQTSVGAIMETLAPLYDKSVNESIAMAFYNDDPPATNPSSSYAHAKGVLATDSSTGFWLVHSMPNWPFSPRGKDGGPNPGILSDDTYGQSFRCVSVTMSTINTIAETLRVDDPLVYEGYVPPALLDDLPSMSLLIDKDQRKDINNTVITFDSLGGTTYYQVAKSKEWDKDLWDDLVAPYFKTPLYVETWIKGGGGRQSSICNTSEQNSAHPKQVPYDIYQVDLVKMPNGDTWTNTNDHSKYCVATQSSSLATCVGDINRMCSQERRGGGALCLEDEGQHTAFTAVVDSIEACYAEDPCVKWDCYYCGNTAGPTGAPSYAPPVPPPSRSPTNPPLPTFSPTAAPTRANNTSPVDVKNNADSSNDVAIAVGVSCGVIAVLVCALLYYFKVQRAKGQSWLVKRRISQMRNSMEGRDWLTDNLSGAAPGEGGSRHRAGSVRSSLDGGGTFGDYVPPLNEGTPDRRSTGDNQATAKEGNVTVTNMGEAKGGDGETVINPLSDRL